MPAEQKGSAGKFILIVGLVTFGLLAVKIGLAIRARLQLNAAIESATEAAATAPAAASPQPGASSGASTTGGPSSASAATDAAKRSATSADREVPAAAVRLDQADAVTTNAPPLVGNWACRVGQLVSDLSAKHVHFNDMPDLRDGAYVRAFYPDGRLYEKFHDGTRGYGAWKAAKDLITDSEGKAERLVYVDDDDLFYSVDLKTIERESDRYTAIGAQCRRHRP